ncbi:MAG: carbon storage regulator CsrA [bacterium]|nr:carbon storage regulator CsrA [bacterium]
MLVLSRKKDETIIIGDNIELTVVEVKGDTVKLGINAPRDVKIFRGELLQAIREQNIEAAAPLAVDLDALTRKVKRKSE